MENRKRVLLISSCGGHWVQMNRIVPAFEKHHLFFASTEREYGSTKPKGAFFAVPEASQTSAIWRVLWQACIVLALVIRIRPHVILTTGAAPGYFALLFGKKLGAKTIWLDSIANVEIVSLAGRKAAKHADLFLTQWPHLEADGRPKFEGAVL